MTKSLFQDGKLVMPAKAGIQGHWSQLEDNLFVFLRQARPLGPFPPCRGRLGRGGVRLEYGPRLLTLALSHKGRGNLEPTKSGFPPTRERHSSR
jgi:hypothetical protein